MPPIDAVLAALTPQTLAHAIYLFGVLCLAAAILIGLLLFASWLGHALDTDEDELRADSEAYNDRRAKNAAIFDEGERIGVLRHEGE
jgi:fatty acid desaturase